MLHVDNNGFAVVKGRLTLDRLAFGLGRCRLANENTVHHVVLVDIELDAQRDR
jgi:hypothetical protein